jgi:hypothetical protein
LFVIIPSSNAVLKGSKTSDTFEEGKGSAETGGPFKKGSEVIENTEKHRFTNRLLGIWENENERE